MQPAQTDLFGAAARRRYRQPGAEAKARKSNGQFRAAERAGSFWLELALDKFKTFATEQRKLYGRAVGKGIPFTFEAFRVWAEGEGLPPPASLNAWGALPTAAKRAGLCHATGGAEPAKRAESHGRLIRVWSIPQEGC